jgi:hypothetical protein
MEMVFGLPRITGENSLNKNCFLTNKPRAARRTHRGTDHSLINETNILRCPTLPGPSGPGEGGRGRAGRGQAPRARLTHPAMTGGTKKRDSARPCANAAMTLIGPRGGWNERARPSTMLAWRSMRQTGGSSFSKRAGTREGCLERYRLPLCSNILSRGAVARYAQAKKAIRSN